jgi:hypothetical protein
VFIPVLANISNGRIIIPMKPKGKLTLTTSSKEGQADLESRF